MEKVEEILEKFGLQYDKKAKALITAIVSRIDKGMEVEQAVNESLKETEFVSSIEHDLLVAILAAAGVGYSNDIDMEEMADTILNVAWTEDNITLAERLNVTASELPDKIIQAIASGYMLLRLLSEKARTPNKTAQDLNYMRSLLFLIYGEADVDKNDLKYDLVNKIKENPEPEDSELNAMLASLGFVAAAAAVIKVVGGTIRNTYERLAVTESGRSWYDGFLHEIQQEDVFGIKWNLSPIHGRFPFDICDVNASADVGWGSGIYRKDVVPQYPAHPFCICHLSPVRLSDVKGGKFQPENVRKYIESLPIQNQKLLFTKEGFEAFNAGADWQTAIKDWHGYSRPKPRV